MKKQDFYFDLPNHLIAQFPLEQRSASRLLKYDKKTGEHQHLQFNSLVDLLEEGDLLVMNDSRVIPARLFGQKSTGGKVEFLIERMLSERQFLSHIKSSKSPKPGTVIELNEKWTVEVLGREDDLFICETNEVVDVILETIGHIPLPPYITRADNAFDFDRYQTVYARHKGSVAAPTAGLHFDETILTALQNKGIQIGFSTLHVGAGTFRPVRSDDLKDHKMHKEYFSVSEELCTLIHTTKQNNKRVIAVGTTAMRSLESAARAGELKACSSDTDIFIYPGYTFKVCDGLLTNFHLPESTLLMLVSAFIGHKQAMDLYQVAITNEYRFFSYGDASLLL